MLLSTALKQARPRLAPALPRTQQAMSAAASEACTQRLRQPLPPDVDTPALVHSFMHTLNMSSEEVERFLDSRASQQAARAEEERGGPPEARKWSRRVVELLRVRERAARSLLLSDSTPTLASTCIHGSAN